MGSKAYTFIEKSKLTYHLRRKYKMLDTSDPDVVFLQPFDNSFAMENDEIQTIRQAVKDLSKLPLKVKLEGNVSIDGREFN